MADTGALRIDTPTFNRIRSRRRRVEPAIDGAIGYVLWLYRTSMSYTCQTYGIRVKKSSANSVEMPSWCRATLRLPSLLPLSY